MNECMCVSSQAHWHVSVHVALLTKHAKRMICIIFPDVSSLAPPYFSDIMSQKARFSKKGY